MLFAGSLQVFGLIYTTDGAPPGYSTIPIVRPGTHPLLILLGLGCWMGVPPAGPAQLTGIPYSALRVPTVSIIDTGCKLE